MPAKYGASYQNVANHRENLFSKLPLRTPFSVQIETASACNFKCKFCMHGSTLPCSEPLFKMGIMKYKDFTKAVDDIAQFPDKLKFLSLVARGEPLLNKQLPDMICYAKQRGISKEISINTNASLLSPTLGKALVEAGLDVIRVSIEGVNAKQYKEVAAVDICYEELVANIRHLYENRKNCYVYIKTIDCGLNNQEKQLFLDTFGDICDSIYIENPVDMWKGADLDQNLFQANRYSQRTVPAAVCPRLFFALVVHYDGTVVPCDADWQERYALGSIKEHSLADMWNGPKMNEMRLAHLNGNGNKYDICGGCFTLTNCLDTDNLDAHLEELTPIYSNLK